MRRGTQWYRFRHWMAVLSIGLCHVGCGEKSDAPKLVPVQGKVTVDGSAIEGLGVSFRPDAEKGNKTGLLPAATVNAEGRYELTTGGRPGAPAGWYKVVVVPPTPPMTGGEAPKPAPPPFNVKYTSDATTELRVEVKEGAAADAYDLKLTK